MDAEYSTEMSMKFYFTFSIIRVFQKITIFLWQLFVTIWEVRLVFIQQEETHYEFFA
jgi:hypothetical protein